MNRNMRNSLRTKEEKKKKTQLSSIDFSFSNVIRFYIDPMVYNRIILNAMDFQMPIHYECHIAV